MVNSSSSSPHAGAPRDLAPEAGLGLVGDAHAQRPGVLAEALDAGPAGGGAGLVVGVAGVGLGEGPDHEDLVAVVVDRRGAGEPAVGQPAGEPALELGGGGGNSVGGGGLSLGMVITVLHRCVECNADRRGHRGGLGVVGVLRAGPEEAPEAVLPVAGARRGRGGAGRSGSPRCSSATKDPVAADGVLHRGRDPLHLRRTARHAWRRRGRAGSRRGRAAPRACGRGTAAGGRGRRRPSAVSSTRSAGVSPAMIEQKRQAAGPSPRLSRLRATRRAAAAASPPSRLGTITLRRK